MKKALIYHFFRELDQELGRPAEIILTGAAAGSLLGVLRPSMDIDFEIRIKSRKNRNHLLKIKDTIQTVAEKVGIAVNFSENIGHWSMINLLDYQKRALPYWKIGKLDIKIMDPAFWTIGKMSRFLEVDIHDILRMIKRKRLKPDALIPLWGRAFRSSPLSLELGNFHRNVAYFITRYGKRVWGRKFDPERGLCQFKKSGRIKK